MPFEEPVSAYGAFKTAKDLTNSNIKYAKKQNGSANRNINKKGKIIKSTSRDTAVGTFNSSKMGYRKKKRNQKKKLDKEKSAAEAKKQGEKNQEQTLGLIGSDSECLDDISLYTESDFILSEESSLQEESASSLDAPKVEEVINIYEYDGRVPPVIVPEITVRKPSLKRKRSKREKRTSVSARKPTISEIQELNKLKESLSEHLILPEPVPTTIGVRTGEDDEQPSTSKAARERAAKSSSPSKTTLFRNSINVGKNAFSTIIAPMTTTEFFEQYWERDHYWFHRNTPIFSHLISLEQIDQMLLENIVLYGKNIDIVKYSHGSRKTANPEGRAYPSVVWDMYETGHSIRLLNPSTYFPQIYALCAKMQEFFHCLVGTNVYLTPQNSQGFAPHHDDIEAFVVQVEGRKKWKLYEPINGYALPRYSSRNLKQKELGECIFEEVLCPGDVLYFPRGTVHQACTEPGYHSLHITFSVYQKQSYADLIEKMLPLMLEHAIANNADLRKGLPIDAFQHAGVAFSDTTTNTRSELIETVTSLIQKCFASTPLENIMDSGIDQMARKFQHEALPPFIAPKVKPYTIFGCRAVANENGECLWDYHIEQRSRIRLLKANILRLIKDEETVRVYFHSENSKNYTEFEPTFIEIPETTVDAFKFLIKSYPRFIKVSELPLPSAKERMDLASGLWGRGLLMAKAFFNDEK